ncbi:EcsC family protein [Faecalitalea cylindroides]
MKTLEKFTYKREFKALKKEEQKYLKKQSMSSDHFINRKLKGKVEPKLEQTLNTAFQKAFTLVFDKGAGIIQKTYNPGKIKEKHKSIDSKSIRKQRNLSKSYSMKNIAYTAVSSTTLGLLGIGIPDIFLYTALIIKNLQEISLSYGIDFNNDNERYFMLMIIEGALAHESIYEVNERVDSFIESYRSYDIDFQIKLTSKTLASELLYLKFIQGIPIVGAISGFYDSKYMNQISKYANLKYQLRFLKNKL